MKVHCHLVTSYANISTFSSCRKSKLFSFHRSSSMSCHFYTQKFFSVVHNAIIWYMKTDGSLMTYKYKNKNTSNRFTDYSEDHHQTISYGYIFNSVYRNAKMFLYFVH